MRIAILGNGRMGKRISELARKRGHIIACVSSSKKPAHTLELNNTDVAIDFSTPISALKNISHAINSGIPVSSAILSAVIGVSLFRISFICFPKVLAVPLGLSNFWI